MPVGTSGAARWPRVRVGSLLIIGCSVEAANILVLGGANRLRIKPAATSEAAVTAAVGSAVSRDALLLCIKRSFSLLARAPTTTTVVVVVVAPTTRVGRELWSTGEFRAWSRSPTRMRSLLVAWARPEKRTIFSAIWGWSNFDANSLQFGAESRKSDC